MEIHLRYFALCVLLTVLVQEASCEGISVTTQTECSWATSAEASRRFAYGLYEAVLKTKKSFNIFLAPTTVASALTMILPGARGETKKQIWSGLKFTNTTLPFSKDNLPCLMRMYDNNLLITREEDKSKNGITTSQDEKTIVLNMANKLFTDSTFELDPSFVEQTREYGAEITKTDFTNAPDVAREEINDWVADKTNNRIQDLFDESSITADTRLAIASAIYFKGLWKYPFKQSYTHRRNFTIREDKKVEVDFLTKTTEYKKNEYFELGLDMIEVPYGDDKFGKYNVSMILIKPHGAIEDAERFLTEEKLGPAIEQLFSTSARKIQVMFPKFKIEAKYKLKPTLRKMGIRRLFNAGNANLSGMRHKDAADKRPLNVNAAIHKTFIEVDEKGTEAAGATGFGFTALSLPERIIFDEPFLFMIYEKMSNGILFIGKVNNPKK